MLSEQKRFCFGFFSLIKQITGKKKKKRFSNIKLSKKYLQFFNNNPFFA